MRKPKQDINEFKKRRSSIAGDLTDSALILTSHPDFIRNNDVHHNYRQDSNFYYLTGFEEPEAIFIFRPGKTPETTMFVLPKDPNMETWEGFRYGPQGVKTEFGIDEAFVIDEFLERAPELLSEVDKVYYRNFYNHEFDLKLQNIFLATKKRGGRSGRGTLPVFDPSDIIEKKRIIKTDYEISLMKKAGEISAQAHIDIMKAIKPGINERALHGVFLKSIMEKDCAREAYPGIFASGDNATTLHYVFNDCECKDGELFLVDAGGEYEYYAGDITRTYPVNGKFTDVQKKLYSQVLELQEKLITMVKPGACFDDLQKECINGLVDIMLDHKLLKGGKELLIKEEKFKKYYPHGVGHWLGMDVHDIGLYKVKGEPRQFEPGMCFTIEPGIYIPANDTSAPEKLRGVGIRIEDNILVTENGYEVLTSSVPKSVEEIEAIIGS